MKKRLLILALLTSTLTMMAQSILNFGFETPAPAPPAGKLEYINFQSGDTRDSVNALSHTGNAALKLQNATTTEGASWQRSLKFRSLPIEPNTSYRLTFWVKGDNTYIPAGATTAKNANINAKMMVGRENADIPFLAVGNKAFDYTFTGFDPANWVKKSAVFYYANDTVQQAYFKTVKPDSVLSLNHFLCLSAYNPGNYFLDDISIKKSTIKGISFNGDVIKVDFGYAINTEALRVGKDYETAVLPVECVQVTLDGVKQEVEAVEVQKNGFYIFLATAYLDDTAEGKLKVSFTNPVNTPLALKYTDALRPNSWDPTSDRMVASFTDEDSNYDMNLTGSSTLYAAPYLKAASPENEAFDLPLNQGTFKLTFSKKIDCSAVKANFSGASGNFLLTLAETGFSDTLTFRVPANKSLASGNAVITVSNVLSEQGTAAEANVVLSYAFGQSLSGKTDTVYMDNWKAHRTTRMIPTGWFFKSKEYPAGRGSGTTQSSGPSLFFFSTSGNFGEGMYIRAATAGDTAKFTYGTYPDKRLHMKAGKHKISFYAIGWKTKNQPLRFVLKDTLGNVVFQKDAIDSTSQGGVNGTTVVVSKAVQNDITFIVPSESNYLMEFQCISTGYPEVLVGKILLVAVPSTAALYKNMLSSALSLAKSALTLADSSIYNGTAKDKLKAVLQEYALVAYTTPTEYTTATGIVNNATAGMNAYKGLVDAHFARIVSYNANLQTAKNTLSTYAGTKYASLSIFPKLGDLVAYYDGKTLTSDDSLTVANDSLTFYSSLMKNYVTTAIPALTYRLRKAITLAKSLKVPVPAADLAEAEAAMTDDDRIVNQLNAKIKQYLSHNLALDSLKLGNSLIDPTATDSVEMTCFIKNPNFYTMQTNNSLKSNSFPGWNTINVYGSGVGGIGTPASAVSPVSDTYVSVFNAKVDSFQQTVTGLPKGIYNIDMRARTGFVSTTGLTQADLDKFLKFYVIHGKDTTNVGFLQAGYGLPSAYISIRNVVLSEGDSFTIGIKTSQSPYSGYSPSLFWGDPSIWLVGKNGTYTGLSESKVAKGAVKDVQYFTIQGFRLNALGRGLNIVRTIYENGAVDVQKIMIK